MMVAPMAAEDRPLPYVDSCCIEGFEIEKGICGPLAGKAVIILEVPEPDGHGSELRKWPHQAMSVP